MISATMTQGCYSSAPLSRLINLFGGYLGYYGTHSSTQIYKALPYMFGSKYGSSVFVTKEAKLIVGFGYNPGQWFLQSVYPGQGRGGHRQGPGLGFRHHWK